jgi:DNA polymerase III epsilon subunit-like protein
MHHIKFEKLPTVITTYIVPWICGTHNKTPEDARKYIKNGSTLNQCYYEGCQELGNDEATKLLNKRLYKRNNIIEHEYEDKITKYYKPWDCLSAIHQMKISDKMGLVARIDGVTKNGKTILICNNYYHEINENILQQLKILAISSMGVWKAKKCIIKFANIPEPLCVHFDKNEWKYYLRRIYNWSEQRYTMVVDTETTGLPQKKGANPKIFKNYDNARMVEIGWIIYDGDDVVHEESFIIHHDNLNYEKGIAYTMHKINNKLAKQEGRDIKEVLKYFDKRLKKCNLIVGHYVDFDCNIILAEMYRHGMDTHYLESMKRYCICANSGFTKLNVSYQQISGKQVTESHRVLPDIKMTHVVYKSQISG